MEKLIYILARRNNSGQISTVMFYQQQNLFCNIFVLCVYATAVEAMIEITVELKCSIFKTAGVIDNINKYHLYISDLKTFRSHR